MTRVSIKPELIRWAVDRSGLPKEDLRKKYPKLDEWEKGERQPTFKQLEGFARTTMTPFGSLLLEEPPVERLPIADFRTKNDDLPKRPSPELLETIYTMQRRQAWMRELLVEDGAEQLRFVGAGKKLRNHITVAQEMRKELDLPPDWAERLSTWEDALTTLRMAAEACGILIFSNSVVGLNNHRPLNPEEFRGFVLCDPYAPLVFLNSADSKSAQMFTLAHELAHVWVGSDGLFNLVNTLPANDANEKFCNKVAAEFLIPEYKLDAIWPQVCKKNKPYQVLARMFKVSPIVAARRILDLKLITRREFFSFYEKHQAEWNQRRAERKKRRAAATSMRHKTHG